MGTKVRKPAAGSLMTQRLAFRQVTSREWSYRILETMFDRIQLAEDYRGIDWIGKDADYLKRMSNQLTRQLGREVFAIAVVTFHDGTMAVNYDPARRSLPETSYWLIGRPIT